MRDRVDPSVPLLAASHRPTSTIDVTIFTPRGEQLAALCVRAADPRMRERWTLPFDVLPSGESLDVAAVRIARRAAGVPPGWIEQVRAFGDDRRHPTTASLSIAYVAVISANDAERQDADHAWFSIDEPPALAPRQQAMMDGAIAALRMRMDHAPIAFRLLPPLFTLSELQHMYELLLGKRLHKASFRRALQSAFLVEATDEWRSEGRGRPAQFYRFSPRKRRGARRGVRFDLLG